MRRRALILLVVVPGASCGSTPGEPGVTPRPPAAMERVAGDEQAGLSLAPLADSAVVRVVDSEGRPVAGVVVEWETEGEDRALPVRMETDARGEARTLWLLGTGTGTRTLRARLDGLEAVFTGEAGSAELGALHEGRRGYIRYLPGALPLIISAGHGGTLQPAEIPDRTEGTLVRDADTDLLAQAIADSVQARFGARPHVVMSRLHRRKLDPNRALSEAAQGNALAEHAWREYHGFLDHARSWTEAQHGPGLYLDIHGHGHSIQRLELGYLLTGSDLARSDDELDALYAGQSSIRALAEASPQSFSSLIRGGDALGTLFEDAGVPAVPSAQQPDPGGDPYFSGGYSTRRHGSRDGGAVSGVQIEAHRPGLRDTAENRARFAGIAAAVLEDYLALHYGLAPVAAGVQ